MPKTCFMPRAAMLAAGALLCLQATAWAGYTTDTTVASPTGAELVDALLAPSSGITVDRGSIVTIGAARQNGRVLSFDVPQRPLGSGIGLSTGSIRAYAEPGHGNDIATGSGANAALSAARGLSTFDQGVLRFSFEAKAGMGFVSGLMLFGSDEYPIWLGAPDYGDALAIRVDGVDVTRIKGEVFSLSTVYQRFGIDPDPDGAGKTGWNGLTPLLRFTAALDPLRSVHEIEFAIADIGDDVLDSALFVSGLQGLEPGPAMAGLALAVPEPGTWALWAAGLAVLCRARRRAAGALAPGLTAQRLVPTSVALAVALLVAPAAAPAASKVWSCSVSYWDEADCWSPIRLAGACRQCRRRRRRRREHRASVR